MTDKREFIMKNVKCFVSMRTDMENVNTVDNSLYIPMLCGAILERQKNMEIATDDVKINISNKKEYLSEFTIQYWAWKNVKADYIGLCHYRRYLAFDISPMIPREKDGLYRIPYLNNFFIKKMGIQQAEKQIQFIEQYDLIINEAANVKQMPNLSGYKNRVYDHWKTADGILLDADYIDYMMKVIKEKTPEIYESAVRYLYGSKHRGFNCYFMKTELFDGLNNFQFSVLKDLGEYVHRENIPLKIKRTYAFIGEILYGIYTQYLIDQKKYKIKEMPLVLILNTYKGNESIVKSIVGLTKLWIVHFMRIVWNILLPYGSKRRSYLAGKRMDALKRRK